MVYQLSWAPFRRNLSELSDLPPEEEEPHHELLGEDQGEPYMYVAEEFIAEEFIGQLPVDHTMLSKMREFHGSLIEEAVIDRKALWKCGVFDRQGVMHGPNDGRTAILCLTMVDPFVKESHMKSIFEQYGECTVNLPDKEGCGLVTFKQRLCAENAFADLATLLKDGNVCCLRWGVDREERLRRFRTHGLRGLEREGLSAELSSLAMSPLHGEKNDREEKAIAMEETTSKRPQSKRPTAVEISKRFQSVRKSASKTKAKRGSRTHY